MHPNAERWLLKHVSEEQREEFREEYRFFLQELWGPLFNYQYDRLRSGYPLLHIPFQTSAYLYYTDLKRPLAFEFVGERIKSGQCTVKEYDAYTNRWNRLAIRDWVHFRFTLEMFEERPDVCKDVMRRGLLICEKGHVFMH